MATLAIDTETASQDRDATPRELLEKADHCLRGLARNRLTALDIERLDTALGYIARAQQMLMASYRPIEVRRGGNRW